LAGDPLTFVGALGDPEENEITTEPFALSLA
jgi:hypothetical protein